MVGRIGDSPSLTPLPPSGESVAQLSADLRANLLALIGHLQTLLEKPGSLGKDDFVTAFHQAASQVSALVTKASQC